MHRDGRRTATGALVALVVLAAGCGGDDGDGATAPPATLATTSTSAPPAPPTTEDPATTAAGDPGCPGREVLAPGTAPRTIEVGGEERSYLLHLPPPAVVDAPPALVVTLHGLGSSAEAQVGLSRWPALADREGVVVAAPQGRGDVPGWDFAPPGVATSDARFVLDVVATLTDELCLDPDRIHLDGMSMGSGTAQLVACWTDGVFASYGGATLTVRPDEGCTGGPVPLRYFHGTADEVVPFAGGDALGYPVRPAEEVVAEWAAANGCAGPPAEEQVGDDVLRRSWSGCDEGADVVFDVIDGGGHTWPGAMHVADALLPRLGRTTATVDATEELWAFYEAHPRR